MHINLKIPKLPIFFLTDYLKKVIVQDRSSKYTKVREIMTEQVSASILLRLFIFRALCYRISLICVNDFDSTEKVDNSEFRHKCSSCNAANDR